VIGRNFDVDAYLSLKQCLQPNLYCKLLLQDKLRTLFLQCYPLLSPSPSPSTSKHAHNKHKPPADKEKEMGLGLGLPDRCVRENGEKFKFDSNQDVPRSRHLVNKFTILPPSHLYIF
jgi:hypothetical protein